MATAIRFLCLSSLQTRAARCLNSDGSPQFVDPSDKDGKPAALPAAAASIASAKVIPQPTSVSYLGGVTKDPATGIETWNYHDTAKSVVAPHKGGYIVIQACIAILILVGFESVTSMGEEAKNAKRDIPRAVILSLVIQGGFCYLFEYFAANYYLNSGYTASTAGGSSAPIGDIMQLVGAWAFGSAKAGWWFMMIEACTVFLALIGTTLSCINTGARVTYAMGRDEEMGSHFGMLHGKNATPHRAIWTLAGISAFIGILTVMFWFCGPAAQQDATIDGLPQNIWYKIGIFHNALASKIPQSFLWVTLVSNFGTFLLYMMSCWIAVVAFHEHHMHGFIKHKFIPIFGLLANLLCMVFYLVGPFFVNGMSWKEPYVALIVAALWGVYGAIYFMGRSKKTGRSVMVTRRRWLQVDFRRLDRLLSWFHFVFDVKCVQFCSCHFTAFFCGSEHTPQAASLNEETKRAAECDCGVFRWFCACVDCLLSGHLDARGVCAV